MLAANTAWEKKSVPPLPRELERRLTHFAKPDEAKVEACGRKLGVLHKLRENTAPVKDGQRRRYDPKKDGRLARGTRVWHELHGPGRVTHGGTGSFGIIEVAFDKGRTGKFVMERVVLELSA